MIDTQELSLGNYLKKIKDIVKVTSFSHSLISVTIVGTSNQILCLPLELEPISLTEEVLLKCGFDFSENAYFSPIFKLVSRLRIVGHDGDFRLLINTKMAIKVEYLHHLQNLYFDLTGEELEVKL